MVPIDTVYQRVLALANKEQRGYITPLEFNLMANQAQQLVFEQYFYDLNQAKRVESDTTSFSDMEELIKNKLALFTYVATLTNGSTTYPRVNVNPLTNPQGDQDYYRTGKIHVLDVISGSRYEAKKVSSTEFTNIKNSNFHGYGLAKSPIYRDSITSFQDVEIYNGPGPAFNASDVTVEIIRKPEKVEWGYDVIAEKALYNASRSANFKLHESEETELVFKILELSGIIINKVGLVEVAAGEDIKKIKQEKA
tara:strand:+ start:256 stop:1011 length:756 start_codon:yes stop_codon:yes gene_type:complete